MAPATISRVAVDFASGAIVQVDKAIAVLASGTDDGGNGEAETYASVASAQFFVEEPIWKNNARRWRDDAVPFVGRGA